MLQHSSLPQKGIIDGLHYSTVHGMRNESIGRLEAHVLCDAYQFLVDDDVLRDFWSFAIHAPMGHGVPKARATGLL